MNLKFVHYIFIPVSIWAHVHTCWCTHMNREHVKTTFLCKLLIWSGDVLSIFQDEWKWLHSSSVQRVPLNSHHFTSQMTQQEKQGTALFTGLHQTQNNLFWYVGKNYSLSFIIKVWWSGKIQQQWINHNQKEELRLVPIYYFPIACSYSTYTDHILKLQPCYMERKISSLM